MHLGKFRYSALALLVISQQSFAEESESTKPKETMVIKATALKVDTPAQEATQSVSVVSQQDLRKRAPVKLDEALRYTAGVHSQQYGSDHDTDWFLVRGFEAATFLDGSRAFKDGHYTWLTETYGLEQVEVLKGPSAILYGETPPGGVVNLVQKKPTVEPQGEVRLELGNRDHRAIAFDVSDKANEDGSIRYRLVGMFKKRNGQLNGTHNDRFYLAPSVAIDISDKTQLTFLSSILKDDGVPTNTFVPQYGSIIDTPNGKIDPETNLGQPGFDKYQRTQISAGYLLEHQLNDTWELTQRLNYSYNKLYLRSTYARNEKPDAEGKIGQGLVYRNGDTNSFTLDNRAVAKWDSSRMEHTLLTGIDLQHHLNKGDERDIFGGFGKINPWKPIYGEHQPFDPNSANDRRITKSQASGYAQYQFKLDYKWIGIMGGRYDVVKVDNSSVKAKQNIARTFNEYSVNAGLMYLADNGLSPYINYSESFNVLSTIDKTTNDLYKPLRGEQAEVGVKYTPHFMDGFFNIALFDLKQKNALVQDANFKTTQTGEVRSKGVELEAVGYVTDNLKISANYTYTNAETDDTKDRSFQQAPIVPTHLASAWVDYDANDIGLRGWNFSTGARYIGDSKNAPKSIAAGGYAGYVPGVVLWDLMVSYEINKNWQAQLNVNNVLNEKYVASCNWSCYYGQTRTAVLSANYRW